MITPRLTRLVRVPDLHVFRHAIAALATGDATPSVVVVVPTASAAAASRASTAARWLTRDQLYDDLHARLTDPPRRLTAFERDALMQAAAAHAATVVPMLPFRLRPGLVAEVLRFYDLLRRQSQQVARFEALLEEALGRDDPDADPGSARVWRQTRFLAEAFRSYEARVLASGASDEHHLRTRLLAEPASRPLEHAIVTVADWIADPDGLFVADFDLLSRLPGLAQVDLICTEGVLGSGFHERLHGWWPGLEEVDADRVWPDLQRVRPQLLTPPLPPGLAGPAPLWLTFRDREEELADVARSVGAVDPAVHERVAVVFKRPLPYLYLAPSTLGASGLPWQTSASLPLAAEPMAAAVDLVLDFVETDFSRDAIVGLLGAPQFVFDGVQREMVSALNRVLSQARYLGGPERLPLLQPRADGAACRPALDAAAAIAGELQPLVEPAPLSQQLRRVSRFLVDHLAVPPVQPAQDPDDRTGRARQAILELLEQFASAHEAHHDPPAAIDDVAALVRRWIGDETFPAVSGAAGVRLLDDQAARYIDVDSLTIVGLVEQEWPEAPRPNIFYPPVLLKSLGWPSERDRRAAADARFLDLLASASRHTTLSTFSLDGESPALRSLQLDEVSRARLSNVTRETPAPAHGIHVAADAVLTADVPQLDMVPSSAHAWADLRLARPPAEAPMFHGYAGTQRDRTWSVSAVETFLGCPFKFFARYVLRLEEEPEDEVTLDPRKQGEIVHGVFERFFSEWQAKGHRAITVDNLHLARELFQAVVDRELGDVGDAEAALERTRLLGSPAAAGLGDAVFRMEAERPIPVVERLLEFKLTPPFSITTNGGVRVVPLRGKLDRIDLLDDGTFRLIDYKLGWPPDKGTALQLPIYGLWAEQQLTRERGRPWTLGEAVYLAFKGPRRVVPLFSSPDDRASVIAAAEQRLADALDRIAAGRFPPSPDDVHRCETCSFTAVCRKDYIGDV